jgi:hypothetical protein
MSDDDEDFNTSEESDNDEIIKKQQNKNKLSSSVKSNILTLEDIEDDTVNFQRPDLNGLYEDVGEDDDGEDETIDSDVDKGIKRNKRFLKQTGSTKGNDDLKNKKKKKK